MAWLIFFKPFEVIPKTSQTPALRLEKFVFRSTTPDGVEIVMRGEEGIKEKRILKIKDIQVEKKYERLLAKTGIYDGALVRLRGDIQYIKKDMQFFSNYALYNIAKKVLKVPGEFTLSTPSLEVKGKELIYNQKSGTISAKNIKATLKSIT